MRNKLVNDYCGSRWYYENLSDYNCTWRRGTQSARRFWRRWGNPFDRYIKKSIKEFRFEARNDAKSSIKCQLNKIDINSDDELIDQVLTDSFNYEHKFGKWYWFD
jgi:hypothetical protein